MDSSIKLVLQSQHASAQDMPHEHAHLSTEQAPLRRPLSGTCCAQEKQNGLCGFPNQQCGQEPQEPQHPQMGHPGAGDE